MDSIKRGKQALPKTKRKITDCSDDSNDEFQYEERLEAYIQHELIDKLPLWANYARTHSTLLLECKTTNPLETFHSVLKRGGTKQQIHNWSLKGAAAHAIEIGDRYFDTAAKKNRK